MRLGDGAGALRVRAPLDFGVGRGARVEGEEHGGDDRIEIAGGGGGEEEGHFGGWGGREGESRGMLLAVEEKEGHRCSERERGEIGEGGSRS